MSRSKDALIAYKSTHQFNMKLAVAPSNRDWMNRTNRSFANRCLPMRIANQAGWVILNDRSLRAKWSGGTQPTAIVIEHSGPPPHAAVSHFGEGILTFLIPFLFRTAQGTSLLFRGPANMPKDAIGPLEGLVETDWAVAPASMNWKFTRSEVWVEFAREEPICMVVPQDLSLLEDTRPTITDIGTDIQLNENFQLWCKSCRDFNERLRNREPEAVRLGWQRYYFNGGAPHAGSEVIARADEHRMELVLHEFAEYIESAGMQSVATPLSGDAK
jgi:hypothetical protein